MALRDMEMRDYMNLKAYYTELWKKERFQFQFWRDFFNADTWDYGAVKETCERLLKLEVGETFKADNIRFIIRSRSDRFIIASTKSGKTHTIVDAKLGVRGPTNRLSLCTDFTNESDTKALLRNLEESEIEMSYRNSIPVNYEVTFE